MTKGYLVACLDDDDQSTDITLATHRVFKTLDEANAYKNTVATSRFPIVISILKPLRYEDNGHRSCLNS